MRSTLEYIKTIAQSKEMLTKADCDKMAEYLSAKYLNNLVKVECIYTDEKYDMSFKADKQDIVILINYKYFLEKNKDKDKITNIFEFFKSFIHEYVHAYRYFNWNKNKNECYNYTVESTIIRSHFYQKGFDFYAKNSNWMLMELEAEMKSAILMKQNIESGEWDMFKSAEFIDVLNKQIERSEYLSIIRPLVAEDCYYSIYDTGVIDVLLKIYSQNGDLFVKYPFLANIIDTKKDIIDMLLQYKDENLDLLRYLIVYLSEEYIFKQDNVLEHISRLSDKEKQYCLEVISSIKTKEELILKQILEKKDSQLTILENISAANMKNITQQNIDGRSTRISLLDELAKTISGDTKTSKK